MNINVSFRMEIIILIVIFLVIIGTFTMCSCSRISMAEGFTMLEFFKEKIVKKFSKMNKESAEGFVSSNQYSTSISGNNLYPLNDGQSMNYEDTKNPIKTDSWFTADLSSTKGKDKGKGIHDIMKRPKQPVPLPKGEMLLFANTPFKPECCPSSFSTGSGCACMTTSQYNYLIDRGGNNVPYSEY